MSEPTDELLNSMLDASIALVRIAAMSIESAPVEVTLPQFRALVVLATRGPGPMRHLGDDIGSSPSSTTRLIERLERKGLVERRASPTSRRSTELHLTPAGAALVEQVMATRARELSRVVARLAPERREALSQAFSEFAAAAGELSGGAVLATGISQAAV